MLLFAGGSERRCGRLHFQVPRNHSPKADNRVSRPSAIAPAVWRRSPRYAARMTGRFEPRVAWLTAYRRAVQCVSMVGRSLMRLFFSITAVLAILVVAGC